MQDIFTHASPSCRLPTNPGSGQFQVGLRVHFEVPSWSRRPELGYCAKAEALSTCENYKPVGESSTYADRTHAHSDGELDMTSTGPTAQVCVVVLAWNHKEDTVECLESLKLTDYQKLHLIVVDNGSTDGTHELLRRDFPEVEVVRSSTNLGIAGGYNLGLEKALKSGGEYVVIANNDIVVDPAMIRNLLNSLNYDGQAGMGMPKIYHYYGDRSRLWCTGARWRRFPPGVKMMGVNARDSRRFTRPANLEFAPSCCLIIRSEALRQVGLFDRGYHFYYDDWDFSTRLRRHGYTILYVPEAKLWHKVSVSTQKSDEPAEWWHTMGRSTVRFYLQHVSPFELAQFSLWFLLREALKLKLSRIMPFLRGVIHEIRHFHSNPTAIQADQSSPE